MLELIDLDQSISKQDYEQQFRPLELELGELQRRARDAGLPVTVVFSGWAASGKGTTINRVCQALDPRGFKVHSIVRPDKNERYHPWMWRFWSALPAAGLWAIFDRSWYRRALEERIGGEIDEAAAMRTLVDARQFERELALSGALIVKFWLQIGKREQEKRFKTLTANPATAWRVGREERRQQRHYEELTTLVEEMIAQTDAPDARWTIIAATQRRFARLSVFRTLINAVKEALGERKEEGGGEKGEGRGEMVAAGADNSASSLDAPPPFLLFPPNAHSAQESKADGLPDTSAATILHRVDLTLSLNREAYEEERKKLATRLLTAENELYLKRIPAVICYEGWDAAGKGGNIRRLTQSFDPRGFEVVPIAAPSAEEKAHHYLWRFWRHVPKAGHITIFDRTWYGRVLVERVEGFCTPAEWKRAYDEINNFERQLADFGTAIVKFWLQIDADEQLRRFKERQETPHKQWKITEEDWRNREKPRSMSLR